MAFEFHLPDIGEGVVEGEIVSWKVAEGDVVKMDQPIVEIMTDKATVEIPSPRAGRIAKINYQAGQICPVGKVLLVIDDGVVVAASAPVAAAGNGNGHGHTHPAAKPAHGDDQSDQHQIVNQDRPLDGRERRVENLCQSRQGDGDGALVEADQGLAEANAQQNQILRD